jgi:flavodoxin
MKILIAYYSKSGNTEKVAQAIKDDLQARKHLVDVEIIKPKKEHGSLVWQFIRLFSGTCEIEELKIKNISSYDAICLGSPNWTRVSLPLASYIETIDGLKYKNVFFFSTTVLPPKIEWYILSAYLLSYSFSKNVVKRGGRIISNLLLSSCFKRWGVFSKYGREVVADFCDNVEKFKFFSKANKLKQKEEEDNRFIVMVIFLLDFFVLVLKIGFLVAKKQFISWEKIAIFIFLTGIVYFSVIALTHNKKAVFAGKYITFGFFTLLWTVAVIALNFEGGLVVVFGYIFLLMVAFSFRDFKVVIFTGLLSLVFYTYLSVEYILLLDLSPQSDLAFLFSAVFIISVAAGIVEKNFFQLLRDQEEIEEARMTLEIKIAARTRELKEVADSLEEKVQERTAELSNKIEELGFFNRLAVGRELKMVELKEQIKSLEGQLKKNN